MLGYAHVPAEDIDGLVKRLAAVVHLAAYAANAERPASGHRSSGI
jgi:GntR family transcriptional regulator/MocR family aminotransferase